LPQITAVLETSSNVLVQHSAISCIDQILEKYGKKDREAASAAAGVIVGHSGLLHPDNRVRVMALLCLSSCVDILGAGIVPLLPQALPAALECLAEGIKTGLQAEKMHNAVFSFLGGLLVQVPWMLSGTYLDRVLDLAHRSAQSELATTGDESAIEVVRLLSKRVDVKECLAAVNRTWSGAVDLGPIAIKQQLEVLGACVERQPKSAIVKHASLLGEIFLQGLDLRRTVTLEAAHSFDGEALRETESQLNSVMVQTILKMNDTTFRPIFSKLISRAAARSPKEDRRARTLRLTSAYGFLFVFFDTLKVSNRRSGILMMHPTDWRSKSIVTSYGSYILETAAEALDKVVPKDKDSKALWTIVARTLGKAFEHDQDGACYYLCPPIMDAHLLILVGRFLASSGTFLSHRPCSTGSAHQSLHSTRGR
jgi:U3 small nucleolar RNA-associated protein 10